MKLAFHYKLWLRSKQLCKRTRVVLFKSIVISFRFWTRYTNIPHNLLVCSHGQKNQLYMWSKSLLFAIGMKWQKKKNFSRNDVNKRENTIPCHLCQCWEVILMPNKNKKERKTKHFKPFTITSNLVCHYT